MWSSVLERGVTWKQQTWIMYSFILNCFVDKHTCKVSFWRECKSPFCCPKLSFNVLKRMRTGLLKQVFKCVVTCHTDPIVKGEVFSVCIPFLAIPLSSWKINDTENDGECLKIEGTQAAIKFDSRGNYLQKWDMGMACGQMAFPCSLSMYFLCTTLPHKNFLFKKKKKHPTWPLCQASHHEVYWPLNKFNPSSVVPFLHIFMY